MPVRVEYLQDHEGNKKGDRGSVLAPAFLRLRRQGIVKRIAPEQPAIIRPAAKKPKGNANSLKNLVKGKKKK